MVFTEDTEIQVIDLILISTEREVHLFVFKYCMDYKLFYNINKSVQIYKDYSNIYYLFMTSGI